MNMLQNLRDRMKNKEKENKTVPTTDITISAIQINLFHR